MNKTEARHFASAAAGAVFSRAAEKAGAAFAWHDCFPREAAKMFAYIERHAGCTAEELYQYAVGGDVDPRPWARVHEAVRVSLEVLVGTYRTLLRLVDADERRVVRLDRRAASREARS